MEKKSILALIFAAIFFQIMIFPLFSQELRQARIFVPQIAGNAAAQDKVFFQQRLIYEIILQYYGHAQTRSNGEFALSAVIMPFTEFRAIQDELAEAKRTLAGPVPLRPIPPVRNTHDRREFFSWDVDGQVHFFDTTGEDNYTPRPSPVQLRQETRQRQSGNNVLHLELRDILRGDIITDGYIIYETADSSVHEDLSIVLYSMLSVLPEIEEFNDWRSKWLFLEFSALWTPRMYSNEGNSLNLSNFGFKIAADFHILDFMALSAGVLFTQDWIVVSAPAKQENREMILEIPLAIKFVFKAQDRFMIEPYAGVSFNTSLMNNIEPSFISWFGGLQVGYILGPGMLVVDTRFSRDLNDSIIMPDLTFTRSMAQVGVGYRFGILQKRPVIRY